MAFIYANILRKLPGITMNDDINKYMTNKEFTDLCNITKNTLVWYQKKGLIKPKQIGENGYHYYSSEQYFDIDLIKSLKWTDTSLEACKDYMNNRSINDFIDILLEQQAQIQEKLYSFMYQKSVIDRTIMAYTAMKYRYNENPNLITLKPQYLLAEKYQEGTPIQHLETLQELFNLFRRCYKTYGVSSSMLNGVLISKEDVSSHVFNKVSYLLLKISASIPIEDCITVRAGKFVSCFHKGKIEEISKTYESMLDFIDKNNLLIDGDAIESDFINHLTSNNEDDFSREILIPVISKPVRR